jgi:RHS repeat-associated protein
MTNTNGRTLAAQTTVALALGALQLSAFAQSLPAPPVSPAPVHTYGYDANGNPTTATVAPSSLNYTTTNTYDNLDRLQTSTDARQGQSSFTYDGQDRNLTVTDPRHLQTQTPRNGLGDVSKLISPDTGSTTYTYDAAGNVSSRTDSRGVRAGYSWDALNRLHYIYYSGGGFATSETYNWDYDQVASGITNGIGRLTGLDYPAGNARYGYDAQGHMVYEQYQVLAQSGINARIWKPISYGYDGAGHVTSITYPSGRVISYSYSGGLLSTIALKTSANASTATNLLSNIHWQPFGAADSWNWQMASGPQAYSRVYDGYGRIVRYPLGNIVRDLTYDDGDRIKSYTHMDASSGQAQPSYDQSFGYDELGRLKTITTNVNTWGIQYDANGNRSGFTLNGTAQAYNIDAASNKLLNIDQSRSFNYDNAGNTKTDSTSYTATYGITGMLASLSKGGITTSYSYNNNGQRIRKTDGTTAGTTVYVYDFNTGNLLGEYDSNGNPIKEYVWMGDTPVAVITPDPVNSANPPLVYYVYSDHLNTPRVIVDQGNNIRWRWLAEPFGNTAPETNPSNLGAFTFNLRFPGQYADQESGLFYNWHRYYDPSLGRYQQSDPIGLAGGQFSTYAYVNGNPLLGIDPNGLMGASTNPAATIPGQTHTPPLAPADKECMRRYLAEHWGKVLGNGIMPFASVYSYTPLPMNTTDGIGETAFESTAEGGGKMLGLKYAKFAGNAMQSGAGVAIKANGAQVADRVVVTAGKWIARVAGGVELGADLAALPLTAWSTWQNNVAYHQCTCGQ